ncbi:aldehyde dehydrogenase family protein [Mesorhizobium sp. M4A.F.Ca.ET.090.04.2.1]|uniref:aldehyde dehydrogenase family protein n=1 Tax=Mesorhizobium sp. M4A.F.Ca.ET.090.04.2.1 TaxID=2496663 RepID=UPI001AECED4C|nr:aldehyde dehydrogenase family protein [Mesorhizobium sp. M4A.F.Ca.ET.090.04.2.1]
MNDDATMLGPVMNERQFERVNSLIESAFQEGATLVTAGTGRPSSQNRSYFVRPTVFAHVTPEMIVAQKEMFGPVVSLIPYDIVDGAIEITNDTPYGMAAYVQSKDLRLAKLVASRLRAGQVINHRRGMRPRRSEASSSRATAANVGNSVSRQCSRSR